MPKGVYAGPDKFCIECAQLYTPTNNRQIWCTKCRLKVPHSRYWSTRRRYRQKNHDWIIEKNRQYRHENRDWSRVQSSNCAHRRRAAITTGRVYKKKMYERDNGICQLCLEVCSWEDASIDHTIPLSKGGVHGPENVQLAHLKCNLRKGNRHDQ